MKIKHLFEDKKDFTTILENPFFKKYIVPQITSNVYYGAEYFSTESQNERPSGLDRSLMFTLATKVFKYLKAVPLHGSDGGRYKTGETYKLIHRLGPRDSSQTYHDVVNELSEDKFGEYIRSLIFVTRSINIASDYSNTYQGIYVLLPLDTPTFYYSEKYEDFFVDFLKEGDITYMLLDEVKDTIPFLVSDNEDALKSVGESSGIDPSDYLKISESSIKKFLESETNKLFDVLTSEAAIAKISKNLKNTIANHIMHTAEKYADIKITQNDIKKLDTIIGPIVDEYISNMKKAVYNLINEYVKSVKETNEFLETDEDSEIMMDCNEFTVIEMPDFIDIIRLVYKNKS
jgi:hypothetical protein